MNDLEAIRQLLSTPEGQKLRDYLATELMELRLIDNIEEANHPYQQAVKLEGQRIAYKKLERILMRLGVLVDDKRSKDPRDTVAM